MGAVLQIVGIGFQRSEILGYQSPTEKTKN
jgi:hypothetical protein